MLISHAVTTQIIMLIIKAFDCKVALHLLRLTFVCMWFNMKEKKDLKAQTRLSHDFNMKDLRLYICLFYYKTI